MILHGLAYPERISLVSSQELSARGVEFMEPPEARPYGIDAGFRDPSGNSFRLTQVHDDFG